MALRRFSTIARYRRKQCGWSQEQLGKRAGVPQSHVAKIEGGSDPRFSTVQRIMGALGYDVVFTLNAERLFLEPVESSAMADARDYGIDLASLYQSYRLSPRERFLAAVRNANGLTQLVRR